MLKSKQQSNSWLICCDSSNEKVLHEEYIAKKFQHRYQHAMKSQEFASHGSPVSHQNYFNKVIKRNSSEDKISLSTRKKSHSTKSNTPSQTLKNKNSGCQRFSEQYSVCCGKITQIKVIKNEHQNHSEYFTSMEKENQKTENQKHYKYSLKRSIQNRQSIVTIFDDYNLKQISKKQQVQSKMMSLEFKQPRCSQNGKIIKLGQNLPTYRSQLSRTNGNQTDRSYAI